MSNVDVNAAYKGGVLPDSELNSVRIQEGLMPSEGDINIAVFLVEFQDMKHDEIYTAEYMEEQFFGDSESLAAFYQKESYDKLNISGDIYGWYTLDNNRADYENGEYVVREMILRELIEKYDSEIDFSKYDNDGDGYTDGIYLIYAGQNEGWNSLWWSAVGQIYSDVVVDNTKIQQVAFINMYHDVSVIQHETGHMLGLIDYYDADTGKAEAYFNGSSLMYDNWTGLDGFSKILLGWITPQKISMSTDTVSLKSISTDADAVIVYPEGDENSSHFFLIEYITRENNNIYAIEGLRIYRINAETTEEGFKYTVSENEPKIIEVIAEGILDGVEITPYTAPSTYLAYEENGVIIWQPTGISITGLKIENSVASFNIGYEDVSEKEISYEEIVYLAENKIFMKLDFDSEMMFTSTNDVTLYATSADGSAELPLIFRRDNYPDVANKTRFYIYTNEVECDRETEYTITVPAGTLQSSYGVVNEDIVLDVTTIDYPEVIDGTIARPDGNITCISSNIIPLEDGKYAYFAMNESTLYMYTGDSTGIIAELLIAEIPEYETNINFRNILGYRLENGEYVVLQRSATEANAETTVVNIFKISVAGDIEKIDYSGTYNEVYIAGNKVVIVDNLEFGTIAVLYEDNEVVKKTLENHNSTVDGVYDIGNDRYLVSGQMGVVTIVNSEMDVISNHKLDELYAIRYATNCEGNIVIVEVSIDPDKAGVNACYYNDDMELLFKDNVLHTDNKYVFDAFYEVLDGYAITTWLDKSYNNVDGSGSFVGVVSSPIAEVVFFDEGFNKVYSYTFDISGETLGDRISSVTALSTDSCIVTTSWGNYCINDMDLTLAEENAPIVISDADIQLKYGTEKVLTVRSLDGDVIDGSRLVWTSSDEKIVTVSDGKIIGMANGTAVITAYMGNIAVNCNVTITGALVGCIINEATFPDAIFREYVSNNFDTDSDGILSEKEIEKVKGIQLDQTEVADLTGIEYFTYLSSLRCYGCSNLTKLDISKNEALESLNCQNTSISELDISNNTKLTGLWCSGTKISKLDVSKHTGLTHLLCFDMALTELDVSKNTELLDLECSDNNIGTLDVSNNTKLIKLSCSNTGITKLDISKNTALEVLYCDKNGLTKLDVSKNVALKELLCNGNQLTSLDVSTNTALETFSAANNKYDIGTVGCVYDLSQIASLDLTKVSEWTNATYADGKLSGFKATGKMMVYYTYDCGNGKKEQFGLTLNYTGEHNYVDGVCADCGALEGLFTITEDESYVYVEGDMNIDTSGPLTMSTFKFYDASGNEVATLELRLGLSYTDTRKSGWLTVDGTTMVTKYAELHYEERKGNKIVISKATWDSYFGDDVVKCKLVGSKQIEELDIEFDAVWDETSKPGVIMWNKVDSSDLEYYMVRLYCDGTIYRTITVSNSSKYDFSQYINESGTYTVKVIAVFNKDLGVKTVTSDAFVYTRPEEELSASAKVWWTAKEGSITPTIINWEPVPGAGGYSFKLYIEGKNASYVATAYNTEELLSSYDLSKGFTLFSSKTEEDTVFKCEIRALSGNVCLVANAADDAVAVSGEYVLAETVEEEIKATVEQTTTDTIIEDIDNVGVDSMADAMQNNEEVLNKVEEVEKDFAKDNNVEVLPPTVEHPEVEAEAVKVVGAALNAASGSSIRLGFEKLDKNEEKHLNEKVYETVIQVDISLKDNEQDVKGKLKAPVTITMKPPKGINKHKLVVLHYLDNGDIERIYPKLNDDGTITFSVTSFSAFVFANLVTYDEGVSDTTLPDVTVTPDEPEVPDIPDEPEIPDTSDEPDTPVVPDEPADKEDDYDYEYDPKDAIENRFAGKAGWQKVSGTWYYFNTNGELKTGWVEDTDGKWYYMDEETGKMQTGWLKSKKSGLWYYMDTENGDMKYGGWLCDPESGRWYYLDANGAMCTSWILVDNKWYLLDTNGAMCTGWNLVNGEWYLLDSDGAMLTGWQTVGDKEYYLDELGKCLMNTTTPDGSKVDETGAKIK